MNRLPSDTRALILHLLCEGNSLRGISRITGVSVNTVMKLQVDAGFLSAFYHDETVRGLTIQRIQCDETWSFCYAKRKNAEAAQYDRAGDVWTWTGIDTDTKLLASWHVGGRDHQSAFAFMYDLQRRLAHRVELVTDGYTTYLEAVEGAFGGFVDYGRLVKHYNDMGHYYGADQITVTGSPSWITTAHVERHNLTMRMSNRRLIRKTSGFSKKFENHVASIALYSLFYNFIRPHSSLGKRMTPAMAAGLADYPYSFRWLVDLLDEHTPPPNRPKKYRKG